jgi:hypothetical protein
MPASFQPVAAEVESGTHPEGYICLAALARILAEKPLCQTDFLFEE